MSFAILILGVVVSLVSIAVTVAVIAFWYGNRHKTDDRE